MSDRIRFMKLTSTLFFLMIMVLTITGCKKEIEAPQEIKTIKLMFSNEHQYRGQYQNLLDFKFPEYRFQLIYYQPIHQPGVTVDDYISFIKEHTPDLIVMPELPEAFSTFIEHGLLADLDPYIRRDRFDLDAMVPSIIELLRNQGDGRLYGLTNGFHSQALFYNIELFDQLRISYPRDRMSYEEVLELAMRFPFPEPDKPVFGFHRQGLTPSSLLLTIGEVEQLKWLDENGPKLTMDSSGWKNILSYVARAYQQGAIYDSTLLEQQLRENTDYKEFQQVTEAAKLRNLFTAGMAAMTIESQTMITDIRRFAPDLQWGIVTVPIDPAHPEQTYVMRPGQIQGIYSGTPVMDDVWRVFQFIHGDEMATLSSRMQRWDGTLPIRPARIPNNEFDELAAFYQLHAEERPASNITLPYTFHQEFRKVLEQQISAVIQNMTTIDEAIQVIQQQGSRELLKTIENH